MLTLPGLILFVCTVLLGVRLYSYIDTIGGSKKDKILIVIFMFVLLLAANFAVPNIFGPFVSLFR